MESRNTITGTYFDFGIFKGDRYRHFDSVLLRAIHKAFTGRTKVKFIYNGVTLVVSSASDRTRIKTAFLEAEPGEVYDCTFEKPARFVAPEKIEDSNPIQLKPESSYPLSEEAAIAEVWARYMQEELKKGVPVPESKDYTFERLNFLGITARQMLIIKGILFKYWIYGAELI